MGMYTELYFNARLKDLTEDHVAILNYMTGKADSHPSQLPAHPLFKTSRWKVMLQMSSYYFTPRAIQLFERDGIGENWCMITCSSLKNYENEIELFIDWISPYIEAEEGEHIGHIRYEECREPTLLFLDLK